MRGGEGEGDGDKEIEGGGCGAVTALFERAIRNKRRDAKRQGDGGGRMIGG